MVQTNKYAKLFFISVLYAVIFAAFFIIGSAWDDKTNITYCEIKLGKGYFCTTPEQINKSCGSRAVLSDLTCGYASKYICGKCTPCPLGEKPKTPENCTISPVYNKDRCVAYYNIVCSPKCTDTDNGKNYSVAGKIYGADRYGKNFTYSDYCIKDWNSSKILLREVYCNGTMPRSISPFYECPGFSVCKNGACVKRTFCPYNLTKTMTAGDTATVNVGKQVVVTVVGVNTDLSTAMVTVDGESKQIRVGQTEAVGGIRVYVKQILTYTVPAKQGAAELIIEDCNPPIPQCKIAQENCSSNDECCSKTCIGEPKKVNGKNIIEGKCALEAIRSNCLDSDLGNYSTKGQVTRKFILPENKAGYVTKSDVCARDLPPYKSMANMTNTVFEIKCVNDEYAAEQYICPYGCKDGACNPEFQQPCSKISKLSVTVTPNYGTPQAKYLKMGDSYIDPVFSSFKWAFTGVTPPLEDASRDIIKFYPSSEDRLTLEFTNKNGQKYNQVIFNGSATSGDAKISLSDGSYRLHVSTNGISENDAFIIMSNASHIIRLKQVQERLIKFQDLAAGSTTVMLNLTNNGKYNFTILNLDGYDYEFRVYPNDTSKAYLADPTKITNKLFTKNGALIELPSDERYSDTKAIRITEARGTGMEGVITLNVSMKSSFSTYDMQVDTPTGNDNNLAFYNIGTSYDKRAVTKHGTYIKYNTNSDVVQLYYPKDMATYQVFLAPTLGLIKTNTTSGVSTTFVEGGAAVETPTKKLYKGDLLNTTKESFTSSDIPILLAAQTITDTDGVSVGITQVIKTINGASVTYSKTPDNLDDPVLNIILSAAVNYNYSAEISFSPAVDTKKLRNKKITLFGKEWTVSTNANELDPFTETGLVLYGGGIQKIMTAGDTATVDVSGTQAVVNVVGVNTDASTAMITINGESKQMAQGATETLGGVRVYVKSIFSYTVPAKQGAVELFIGTDKLVLRKGAAAKIGSSDIDGTKVGATSAVNSDACR